MIPTGEPLVRALGGTAGWPTDTEESRGVAAGAEGLVLEADPNGPLALGSRELKLDPRRAQLEDKQAAAATGQILLAHAYQETLGQFGIKAAQVLLTLDDSESRRRYLNASRTLLTLLRCAAVPVVNENDTVATQELRYGDNDRLGRNDVSRG